MGSKTIETPHGMVIVDDSIDENEFDPESMLPLEMTTEQTGGESFYSPGHKDEIQINGEEFKGFLKKYTVHEDKKTKVKTIRVILVCNP